MARRREKKLSRNGYCLELHYLFSAKKPLGRIFFALIVGFGPSLACLLLTQPAVALALLGVLSPFWLRGWALIQFGPPSLLITAEQLQVGFAFSTIVIDRRDPVIFVVTGDSPNERIVVREECEGSESLAQENRARDRVLPPELCRRPEKLAQFLNRWHVTSNPDAVIREMRAQLA